MEVFPRNHQVLCHSNCHQSNLCNDSSSLNHYILIPHHSKRYNRERYTNTCLDACFSNFSCPNLHTVSWIITRLQVPFSKILTFFRRSPFVLRAEYGAGYPGTDKFIGTYAIKDIVAGPDGASQKVSSQPLPY